MSLGRMIGKAAKAVAPLAQASALESMRQEFTKDRDAALNQYRTQERKDTQAHQTSERLGAQDFTAGQNQADREQRGRQIAVSEEQLALNKEQAGLVAQQIEQELQVGQYKMEEVQQLQDIRNQILATDDPQEQQSLYEKYLNIQGKEPDNKFSFIRVQGDFDEPDALVRGNTRSGRAERINLDGVEEADPLGIR